MKPSSQAKIHSKYDFSTFDVCNYIRVEVFNNIFIFRTCLVQTNAGVAKKYPVMVYIHGGEFIHGASNHFPAHILAGFYDVVVVSMNYRLGALGT